MDVSDEILNRSAIVTIVGRVDQATSAELEKALLERIDNPAAGTTRTVIDMAGVSYISSVGLRALMVAAKHAKKQQREICAAAATEVVEDVFRMTKFHFVLKTFATREDADAAAL